MNIIIQKFGGTSVATKETRQFIVKKVSDAINKGYNPVVVVSAMGRLGDTYSTDNLLSLLSSNFKNNNYQATDLLVSTGEIISSVVMCNDLFLSNIQGVPLTGGQAGIITDDQYKASSMIEFQKDRIINIIKSKKVPVVCGFQGITREGFITTLGRGGSDTTAAILGANLGASKIEIYTDVDGIMTADPKVVKDASLIRVLNYNEVFQLADQGAKVIHPKAVEYARQGNVPLVIKNTFNDSKGTIINGIGDTKSGKVITSITSTGNRCQVKINFDDNKTISEYSNILCLIADENISLDLINIFPKHQVFTISIFDKEKLQKLFNRYNIIYEIIENCSKVSLIGSGMKGIPGVMAKIYRALDEKKIEVLQTADSHMTIWCLVRDEHLNLAINTLHKEFNL